jgi:DNA-directed RNA polymerase specialized sigma24 family protein
VVATAKNRAIDHFRRGKRLDDVELNKGVAVGMACAAA